MINKVSKIYYWSPFTGRVATTRSVANSAISIKKFSSRNTKVSIIDCYGEWNRFYNLFEKNKIKVLNLQNKIQINIDAQGFLKSRFIYIFTFFLTYFKLKKIIKEDKPEYLLVHLLTYIPIILFFLNNFKTKLVLRISGKPKLTILRYLLWKLLSKKIVLVFSPTNETIKYLNDKKVFPNKKVKFLPDPIINEEEIKSLKKNKIKKIFNKNDYFLSIGRLTKQKNHMLVIKAFSKYNIKEKLLIIGNGELKQKLKQKIKKANLVSRVKIINYQKNIFDYIYNSKGVIVSSLWEDPGFVMVESAFSKKIIISSDCPSGPKEFLGKNKAGFLFKNDNQASFFSAIKKLKKTTKAGINLKLNKAKEKSKIYTIFNHYKILSKHLKV
jgi:glycosyltransferase involved in cell wall biosynthesis